MDVVPVPTPGSSCCQVLLAAYTFLGQSLSSPEPAAAVVFFLLSNITSNLTRPLGVMLSVGPGPSAIASIYKFLQASYPCGPTFSPSAALKPPSTWSSRLSLAPTTSPNPHTSCVVGFRPRLLRTSRNKKFLQQSSSCAPGVLGLF